MISAHENLATAIDELIAEVVALRGEVSELRREKDERMVTGTVAGQLLGYSRTYISPTRTPWRYPGFRVGQEKHTLSAWRAHLKGDKTDKQLRAEWEALPWKQRSKLMGIAV
jgi:hypothetical protein